jgi:alcohol dehydrogenase class IV
MFDAPHGAVCAALLGPVVRVNVAALRARAPDDAALARYREVAVLLTDQASAEIEDGLAWIDSLRRALEIPALARYGMRAADVPRLVDKARAASSMKGNPLVLTDAELTQIAEAALTDDV